jgi:hypothetical protein
MEFVARYLPWRRTNRAELDVSRFLSDPAVSKPPVDPYLPRGRVTDAPGAVKGGPGTGQAPGGTYARAPAAAYRSTAADALTLSDSIRPRSGIETSASHARATRGRSPRPSDPRTSTTGPFQSTA